MNVNEVVEKLSKICRDLGEDFGDNIISCISSITLFANEIAESEDPKFVVVFKNIILRKLGELEFKAFSELKPDEDVVGEEICMAIHAFRDFVKNLASERLDNFILKMLHDRYYERES